MGEYVIKRITKSKLDENEEYERKEKLEQLLEESKNSYAPNTKQIKAELKKHNKKQNKKRMSKDSKKKLDSLNHTYRETKEDLQTIEEISVNNAIVDGTTFYANGRIYAVFDDRTADRRFFYEIKDEHIDKLALRFKEILEESKKENISEIEIANLFDMNYCINIVGLSTSKLEEVNQYFRNYLKELIKIHGAEKVKEGFKKFFVEIDDNDIIENVDPPIKVGKYKDIMRYRYLASLIKDGIINFSDLQELEANGEIKILPKNEELFEQIYEPEKGPAEYFIDFILYIGKAKTREEAIEIAFSRKPYLFLGKKLDLDMITTIVNSNNIKFTDKKEDEDLKKRFRKSLDNLSVEDIKKLFSSSLTNLIDKELLSTRLKIIGLTEDCFNREQLMKIITTLPKANFNNSLKRLDEDEKEKIEDKIIANFIRRYDGNLDENNIPADEKGLTFKDILQLKKQNYIKNQDIIKLINATDKIESKDKKREHLENIAMFYSFDKLMEMLRNGEINQRFVDNYKKFIEYLEKNNDEIDFKEIKEKYFQKMKEDLEKSNNPMGSHIALLKTGLKIDLNRTIPMEVIMQAAFEHQITDKDIIAFFKQGAISSDTLSDTLEYSKKIKTLVQER